MLKILGAELQADGGNEVRAYGLKHQKEKRSMDHFAGRDAEVRGPHLSSQRGAAARNGLTRHPLALSERLVGGPRARLEECRGNPKDGLGLVGRLR
jgi:hypothetical protein